ALDRFRKEVFLGHVRHLAGQLGEELANLNHAVVNAILLIKLCPRDAAEPELPPLLQEVSRVRHSCHVRREGGWLVDVQFIVAGTNVSRAEQLFATVTMKPPSKELDLLLRHRAVKPRHLLDQLIKLHLPPTSPSPSQAD